MSIWRALLVAGFDPLETYPHGIMWRLAGRQLRHKKSSAGALARLQILEEHIDLPVGAQMWAHDGVDALAAALVAWQSVHGIADRIDCSNDSEWPSHDGSSMWLPPHRMLENQT
jgi:hypothetical protein